jgi:hypothetical protein
LVVKVKVHDLERQMAELTSFVTRMFPTASLISENGGLFTYRIPKNEAKMGLAFGELEVNKEALQIEDYSLAQPTLEQVFIRTVNEHSTVAEGATQFTVKGGLKDAIERLSLSQAEGGGDKTDEGVCLPLLAMY